MGTAVLRKPSNDKRYFIAIIPPSPIYEQAWEQKQYLWEHFDSKASLNSPPHITLHMPFKWSEKKEQELAAMLGEFTKTREPVKVNLDGYSSFPPRVVFINVLMSEPLKKMQYDLQHYCKVELNLFNANYRELPFHPHITIAFRDLKKPNYQKAWDEFRSKSFQAEFLADTLTLLKHDGKFWQRHIELPFK
ncbi:MAG: 2'-5' RNA ligase family protein [Chryseolinea sp.]